MAIYRLMTKIGYEKTLYKFSYVDPTRPDEYEAARLKGGRVTERSPRFATEKEADAWIEQQRQLDADDKFRETGRWTKAE